VFSKNVIFFEKKYFSGISLRKKRFKARMANKKQTKSIYYIHHHNKNRPRVQFFIR